MSWQGVQFVCKRHIEYLDHTPNGCDQDVHTNHDLVDLSHEDGGKGGRRNKAWCRGHLSHLGHVHQRSDSWGSRSHEHAQATRYGIPGGRSFECDLSDTIHDQTSHPHFEDDVHEGERHGPVTADVYQGVGPNPPGRDEVEDNRRRTDQCTSPRESEGW